MTKSTVAVRELLPHVDRLIITGFSGRDVASVQAHVDELVKEGIPAPEQVPSFYPVPLDLLTTATDIEVSSRESSGEVEPVLFFVNGERWLSIASDHTARDLERQSIQISKEACAKVIGQTAWRFDDIADRFDELQLHSEVRVDGTWQKYQQAPASSMLPVNTILELCREAGHDTADGLAILLGTVPLLTDGFVYGEAFRGDLNGPGGDSLRLEYNIDVRR